MTDREKLSELICEGTNHDCGKRCNLSSASKCFSCTCLADHLLANGVTFATDTNDGGKWISVEDEKPKRRGRYFVAYKFGDSDMRFFGCEFWHDDIPDNGIVKGDHFSNEGVQGMRVTHWMKIPEIPLQEPPKEG